MIKRREKLRIFRISVIAFEFKGHADLCEAFRLDVRSGRGAREIRPRTRLLDEVYQTIELLPGQSILPGVLEFCPQPQKLPRNSFDQVPVELGKVPPCAAFVYVLEECADALEVLGLRVILLDRLPVARLPSGILELYVAHKQIQA